MREYSTQGRWPSPDPAGLAALDPTNPLSWNRYAYVRNNPISYIDPQGLFITNATGTCEDFFYSTTQAQCGPEWDLGFDFPMRFGPHGGGGGGVGFTNGGGAPPEQPRPFPWPLLPPGFFFSLESGGGGSKTGKLAAELFKPCGCHQNFANPHDCSSCCLESTLAKQAACIAAGLAIRYAEPLIDPCVDAWAKWGRHA